MKNLIVFISTVILLCIYTGVGASVPEQRKTEEPLHVWYSPDLHAVIQDLANSFRSEHQEVELILSELEGATLTSSQCKPGNIVFVTKDKLKGLDARNLRMTVIGREVYLPLMNSANPLADVLRHSGLSPGEIARIFSEEKNLTWGSIFNNGSRIQIHPVRTGDQSFLTYLSDFTGLDKEAIKGAVFESSENILSRIEHDKNAIGFCTLTQLKNYGEAGIRQGISMLPIDVNANDQLDQFEQIYGSLDDFCRGVWIGKYPGKLYSRIYAVSSSGLMSRAEHEWLSWIAGAGQAFVASNGYTPLLENENKTILASLDKAASDIEQEAYEVNKASGGLIILLVLAGCALLIYIGFILFRRKPNSGKAELQEIIPGIIDDSYDVPGGYFFDRSHTWTYMEKDGSIRIGIDAFIQRVSGKITRVIMKKNGDRIIRGEVLLTLIQDGKQLQIASPVSGTIMQENTKLDMDSTLLNTSPYSGGWVYLVKSSNWLEEFKSFLSGSSYSEWIKSEYLRLKDFLNKVLQPENNNNIVFQEGGEICDGVLQVFGPELWEDFQSDFLTYNHFNKE